MPTGNDSSDTTEPEFPSDGTNPFEGKSPSPAESNSSPQEGSSGAEGGQQRAEQPDTTGGDTGAEPAKGAQPQSESEAQPSVGDEADTTVEEPTPGDEARRDGESTDSRPEDSGADEADTEAAEDEAAESEADEDTPEGEPEEEADLDVPFQYHGTEPDGEEYEDFVFISEVDPDQRYEDVEDLVNGVENQIQHIDRQHNQIQTLQSQLAEARAEQEGEVAEMRAKLSIYEDELGEDQIVEALADRHMPDKFQGLSKEEVPADEQEEYIRARTKAEIQAEDELEEAEAARTEAQEEAKSRQERVQGAIEEANDFLERLDHEDLGLEQEEAERYAAEALSQMAPEDTEMNHLDLAHRVLVMPELLPEAADFSKEEAQLVADGLVEAVGATARELKRQEMQSRTSKIQTKQSRSRSRADDPEPASSESARRQPGKPKETFMNA